MQDNFVEIQLMDVVSGTSTNADGLALFIFLDEALSQNQKVRLSFLNATPFASSFLNSSFGNLVEKYGIDQFRMSVVITNYSLAQVKKVKEYIEQIPT